MSRVDDAQVKCIKSGISESLDTTPWIEAASTVVDTINESCGTSFDEDRLTQIELFLAAHFVGTIVPQKVSIKFENYAETYQVGSNALMGVMTDKYGQTANMLSGGCLSELDKPLASVDFL